MGCVVEEAEPDFAGADETFRTLRFHSTFIRLSGLAKQRPGLMKETLLWEVEQGSRLTEREIQRAQAKYKELRERMGRFLSRYEFFVLPVNQVLPFDVSDQYPMEIEGVKLDTYIDWFKSCYYISVTATPAISVPCGFTSEGLPVGLQIVSRAGNDWGLLQMSRAFEAAKGLPARKCAF